MCTRWRITYTVYTPYLANSSTYCTYHFTAAHEVQLRSNFDHTTFLFYIWITRWLHQMNFQKRKRKKSRSQYISAELESSPSLSLPCTSIYHLIIQSENENWSLKHLYLNKEREADYEFSKCNFYYTSIIPLLITDSFSLCSSSKTCSYSIHVHTGTKKILAWLCETFKLWRIHPTAGKKRNESKGLITAWEITHYFTNTLQVIIEEHTTSFLLE